MPYVSVHIDADDVLEELSDADILVMAFGRSRRPGETRLNMFDDSIKIFHCKLTRFALF